MLLQQIVEKLDAELDRLQRLREILAGLRGSPPFVLPSIAAAAEVVEVTPAPMEIEVKRLPPRAARGGGGTRRARPVTKAHTALTSAIPARPVVVSADALAKENAAKREARPVKPKVVEGTLGAMIRALGQQGAV